LFLIEKHSKLQKSFDHKANTLSNKRDKLKEIIQNIHKKRHFDGKQFMFELNYYRQTLDEFDDLQKEAEVK
jgi:hypothetical protein